MLSWSILLVGLCAFSAANAKTFNSSVHRTEAENSFRRLIREERWDEARLSLHMQRYRLSLMGKDAPRQPFYDYSDLLYIGKVVLGTPGVEFRVVLDTGSANFWVVDQTCPDASCPIYCKIGAVCTRLCNAICCDSGAQPNEDSHQPSRLTDNVSPGPCNDKTKYDASKSSSHEATDETFKIRYGKGSASGALAIETVQLGDADIDSGRLKVTKQYFGKADKIATNFAQAPIDGILGLAFPSIDRSGHLPVFHNAVKQKLVDEPIFTVWLKHDGSQSQGLYGGQITYGGYDSEHCTAEDSVHWVTLAQETWWAFDLDATGTNGKKNPADYLAASDTGTSLIIGPKEPLDILVKASGATFDSRIGLYSVPCDAKFTWSIWAGGKKFAIQSGELVLEVMDGFCILGYMELPKTEGLPDYILGDPWVRSFCQVHDIEHGRIGFSVPKPQK